MKKSQLRNIIKESIKELMTEQSAGWWNSFFADNPQITPNDMVGYCADSAGPGYLYNPAIQDPTYLGIINNLNPPYDQYPLTFWTNKTGCSLGMDGFPNDDGTDESCCFWYSSPPHPYSECSRCNGTTLETNSFQSGVIGASMGDPAHCPPGWQLTSLGTLPCQGTVSTSGCDPNAPFPPNFNLQNWTNTWTSLPNFSSSNPNQPCNFVCQRRNQWTSQLAAGGMGPKQTNMVACKLEEAEAQYLTHNCATSNANNCP
jgi:hypothetical protein